MKNESNMEEKEPLQRPQAQGHLWLGGNDKQPNDD